MRLQLLLCSIIIVITGGTIWWCYTSHPGITIDQLQKEYDYIVIGAGTAGSVIASRLAKYKNSSVLVLEAGDYIPSFFDIPSLAPVLQATWINWNYFTTPQEHCCGALRDRKVKWPLGKGLGGSGRLNYMIYIRGVKSDYDRWYQNYRNYNFENDVLWYFKKSQHSNNGGKWNGKGGPLNAVDLRFSTGMIPKILGGADELGLNTTDLNDMNGDGFMQVQVNQQNGGRWSTGHSFISQLKPNILFNSQVTKINMYKNYEARSVEFINSNRKFKIRARKEIVLSAGVIGSPKILSSSKIGTDLKIGSNVMDHLVSAINIEVNTTFGYNVWSLISPKSAWNYFAYGSGPWTSTGCEIVGIVGNVGFMALPFGVPLDHGLYIRHMLNLNDEIWNEYFKKLSQKQTMTILPIVLHPKSRGLVKFTNGSVEINPNYLSHPDDLKTLVNGVNFIKKLLQTKSMRSIDAKIVDVKIPNCDVDDWECYLRQLTFSTYHPVGSCKMGDSEDPSTVVDWSFKVHRTNKLRVADGSVFPYLTSGNTNAVVAMIAEKVVDEIKKYDFYINGKCTILDFFKI